MNQDRIVKLEHRRVTAKRQLGVKQVARQPAFFNACRSLQVSSS